MNSCVTLVSITIVLMTVCSQQRPFGVFNYAPSHLINSTKGASLIPRIGFARLNAILLLYFIPFYLLFSERFALYFSLLHNSYAILCELFFFILFLCSLFISSLLLLLFCNLFKAFSLFVNFIPSIDILNVEKARMAETSTWI